jgi:hypothetical protein
MTIRSTLISQTNNAAPIFHGGLSAEGEYNVLSCTKKVYRKIKSIKNLLGENKKSVTTQPSSKPLCMSLRGALFATKQFPSGQFSLINGRLLRQKTARNDMAE